MEIPKGLAMEGSLEIKIIKKKSYIYSFSVEEESNKQNIKF